MIIIYDKDTTRANLLQKWIDTIEPSMHATSFAELFTQQDLSGVLMNIHLVPPKNMPKLRRKLPDTKLVGYCSSVDEEIKKACDTSNIHIITKPITQQKVIQSFSSAPVPDTVTISPLFLLEHIVSAVIGEQPHLARFYDNYSPILEEACRICHFNAERLQILHALATIHAAQLVEDAERETISVRQLSRAFLHTPPVCLGSRNTIDEKTLNCIAGLSLPTPGNQLESELLVALFDFHLLKENDISDGDALLQLKSHKDAFLPKALKTLKIALGDSANTVIRKIYPLGLQVGMQLGEDLFIRVGDKKQKLAPEGYVLDKKTLQYIQKQSDKLVDITKPISVVERIE